MTIGITRSLFVPMATPHSFTRWYLGALLVLLAPAFLFAAEFRVGEQVSLPSLPGLGKNAYLAGGSVVSDASLAGDLSVAGGTIVVNGKVGQDLLAAGGNISVVSDVGDDVRIAGGTIVMSGAIGNDLAAAGGQVTVTGARIGGDVLISGGTVHIAAPVAGSARISGGSVTIDAPITGNVEVHAQSLTLGSKAVISGDLMYEAPRKATLEDGAVVKGETDYTPIVDVREGPAAAIAVFSVWILAMLASLIVSALVVFLLFGRYTRALARDVATTAPLRLLGIGFLAVVAIPVAAFVMFLTVVGVPLGVVTLAGYVILLVFSWIVAPVVTWALVESWWFNRAPEVRWQTIVYGALIYLAIGLVPFVGWIVKAAIFLVALGALIEKKREIASEWV